MSTPNASDRGAAQVSLMWVIAFAVIALVAALFAFLQNDELTQLQEEYQANLTELQKSRDEATALRQEKRQLADQLGFKGDGEFASTTAIEQQKAELVRVFGLDDANINTFEDVVAPVVSRYQQVVSERDALQAETARLRNDLAERESAVRAALAEKDQTLADLRREKDELQASLQRQIVDLERQRDSLRDEFRNLERQLAELRTQADQRERELKREMETLQQRNSILSDRLNAVERRAQEPDGSVLAVDDDLGLVWIDLGRLDRLTPGMEFAVVDPLTGREKGRIEVVEADDHRAKARVLSVADVYDPIRTGDRLLNPIYDPNRTPIAVLLGNGFGRFSPDDLRAMLSKAGVEVRDRVTEETDYLLLGTPFFDEETGDLVPWESYDPYKVAESLSVEIVPMRDWSQWLGL